MKTQLLYKDLAGYYDLLYKGKDYSVEVGFLEQMLKRYHVNGKDVLDIACGTGNHTKLLTQKGYDVTGIDLNSGILKLARKKAPKAKFAEGDMRNFSLGKKFDLVLCLFTAINYNLSIRDLTSTLVNFKRHLNENGLIVFDAPLPSIAFDHATLVDKNTSVLYHNSDTARGVRELDLFWLFNKKGKIEVVRDTHLIRLYRLNQYKKVIKENGLNYQLYWNFSSRNKSGRRAVFVCYY